MFPARAQPIPPPPEPYEARPEEGPAPEEPARPEGRPDKLYRTPAEQEYARAPLMEMVHPNAYSIMGINRVPTEGTDVLLGPRSDPSAPDMPFASRSPNTRRNRSMHRDYGTTDEDRAAANYYDSLRLTDKTLAEALRMGTRVPKGKRR